jgi:hypothetical protein
MPEIATFYAVAHSDPNSRIPDDEDVSFFGHVDYAVEHRDRLGGDARVYRCEPLSESGHWDWGVRNSAGDILQYVNGRSARNSVGSGTLVRRRCGTSNLWEEVDG